MTDKTGQKFLIFGTTLAYLLIGLEVLFMITPFALFFYSVYGPILRWLASSPLTAWTTEFFMPHLVFVSDPLLVGFSYLQALFVIGLGLFLLGAPSLGRSDHADPVAPGTKKAPQRTAEPLSFQPGESQTFCTLAA